MIILITNFSNDKNSKGDRMNEQFTYEFRKQPKKLQFMSDRAQEILEHFCNDNLSGSIPIVEIFIKFGFRIYQSYLEPEEMAAYIAVDPIYLDAYGSDKIACVNIYNNIGQKRFSLAHELGHYLFDFDETKHKKYYDTFFPGKTEDKIYEKRANRFARELLMPKNKFINKYQTLQPFHNKVDIVDCLGEYFLVTNTEVLKRLNELKMEGFEYGEYKF